MLSAGKERFFLVREDILPEAMLKTVQAMDLLSRGEARTVHEAAEKVGLSRSAFYKYKDGVFPMNRLETGRIATISLDLRHQSGMLSKVLALIAEREGNVLTIHQSIPLQGMANVVISVDTTMMGDRLPALMEALRQLDGVRRAFVIGQG